MKESYGEGVALHTGPESCAVARKGRCEALTGVRTGQPLSSEINVIGTPTLLSEAEGHTVGSVMRELLAGSALSKTLSMCGNSLHGNREVPKAPCPDGGCGRSGKATSHTPDMHAFGKSDDCIVPRKLPNKDIPAEAAEGRQSTKGNTNETDTSRTQSRTSVSSGLMRVRAAARKDKGLRFTTLLHHITPVALKESYYNLKRQAKPGVDGVTWTQYQEDLEDKLTQLHKRIHEGTYRALPSKRVFIPKQDGTLRPLGIAALEDKIVQHAVGQVLTAIYEEDFLGFSYGFRPGRGQHDALDSLYMGLTHKKVSWVVDADIQGFFDSISHEWMLRFVEHRIADPRILRLISKWLHCGVLNGETWERTTAGTPQGAVLSPLLANIYLHYVLDLWIQHCRRNYAEGDIIIVRYADDFVVGFQYRHEAESFLKALKERFGNFGLTLHPKKTRLIEFGRFAAENRRKRGMGKAETFDFLGFTHICSKHKRSKGFYLLRKTVKVRLRAALARVKERIRKRMHGAIEEVGQWLRSVMLGYYRYHAIPGNWPALQTYTQEIAKQWYATLRRRGQKRRITWKAFAPIVRLYLPRLRIMHPLPRERFLAKHPR